jgi:cell wall-associated NlpC family hydrolase
LIKELLLVGTTVIALTTSGVGVAKGVALHEEVKPQRGNHISVAMLHAAQERAEAETERLRIAQLQENTDRVAATIKKLNRHVDKTWYVFSGATPSGWDCSGLTMWFYEQLGVTVEHRASKQSSSGIETNDPKPGDLVVFKYKGSKTAYHVGIYIGNGKMIDAPRRGELTRIENVFDFAGKHSKIEYRSFIETL